jgi:hypothetical protein
LDIGIPSEKHLASGDSTEFGESETEVLPMVDRENRHCRIEGTVIEGKVLGHSLDGSPSWVLRKHHM